MEQCESALDEFAKSGTSESHEDAQAVMHLRNKLLCDNQISLLRRKCAKLGSYFKDDGIMALSQRGDGWVTESLVEPTIGKHFRVKCSMRFLEPTELKEGMGFNQVIFRVDIENWPQSVEDHVALDRETDLYRQDMIEDCKGAVGEVGGPDRFMSSMLYYKLRPAMVPLNLDCAVLRHYVVCDQSPMAGLSPGVFVIEESPDGFDGATCEGFAIPAARFATKRLCFRNVKYFSPSVHEGCSTQTLVGHAGLPAPKFMLPLSLMNKILISTTLKSFLRFKSKCVDRWEEAGFSKRVSASTDFYGAVVSAAQQSDT